MEEKILSGEDALMAIQAYSVLKVINETLVKGVEETLATGYTDEIAKKVTKEAFTVIAISNELEKVSASMTTVIEKISGLKGKLLKLDIVTFPEIKISSIKEEEINKNTEVEKC